MGKCCDDCPGDDTCKHNTVCMCGCYMKDHDDMWRGHSGVSMHEFYSSEVVNGDSDKSTTARASDDDANV